MSLRRMRLPPGWYPRDAEGVRSLIRSLSPGGPKSPGRKAFSGVSPHAGWHYCAKLAVKTFERLDEAADVVIVFGGHVPAGAVPRLALEEAFETPLGEMDADEELRELVAEALSCVPDATADNTVEVLLPFARYFFPRSRVLSIRVPNDVSAVEIGKRVALGAMELGRTAVAVGSTDLTHYGEAYDFAPKGGGSAALDWVREVNDARIVEAMRVMDAEGVVRLGEGESSACSSGAAAAAISFASSLGASKGEVNGYATSAEADGPGSRPEAQFVGYASVSYLS